MRIDITTRVKSETILKDVKVGDTLRIPSKENKLYRVLRWYSCNYNYLYEIETALLINRSDIGEATPVILITDVVLTGREV